MKFAGHGIFHGIVSKYYYNSLYYKLYLYSMIIEWE
jgi:hypothetical protein